MLNAIECGLLLASFTVPTMVTFEVAARLSPPSGPAIVGGMAACVLGSCLMGLACLVACARAYLWMTDRLDEAGMGRRRLDDGGR